jgi:O-antigen/teichoic acid export membrane protein
MNSVSEPLFSALQDDHLKYRSGFQKTVSTLSLITMPLAAGVFVCSKQLVALLLGQQWAGAVDLVKILAIAMFIKPAFSAVGFVMVTCGKTGRYVIAGLLDSIALVAAVSVGVMWGARGVAVGHVAATYVVFLPLAWWTLKDTPVGISIWLRAIARPAACSLFMVAILELVSGIIPFKNNFAILSSYVSVGVACYFVGMLAIPGGKGILRELLRDCQSALGLKSQLHEVSLPYRECPQ